MRSSRSYKWDSEWVEASWQKSPQSEEEIAFIPCYVNWLHRLSPGQEKDAPGKGCDPVHPPVCSSRLLLLTLSSNLTLKSKQNKPRKRWVSSLAEYASDVGPENFVTEPPVLLLPQTARVCWMWSPLRTYKTTCCKPWSSSSRWTTLSPLSSLPNCSRKWQTSDKL